MNKTLRNILRVPLGAALLFSLTACPSVTEQVSKLTTSEPSPPSQPAYSYPVLAEAKAEQVPGDLQAIAGAVTQRLYGAKPNTIRRQLGVVNSKLVKPRKSFPLTGFRVAEVQYLDAKADRNDPRKREVALVINFQDAFQRRASVKALVSYQVKAKKRVDMTKATWTPVTEAMPAFETFVVPTASFAKISRKSAKSYRRFYNAVVKSAIPRAQLAERIEQGGEFVVAAFGKSPVGQNASIALELSRTSKGKPLNADGGVTAALFPGRYPVMIMAAELQAPREKPFWIRLIHTPGEEAGDKARAKPILVDLFPLADEAPTS